MPVIAPLDVDLGGGVAAGFTTRAGGVSPDPWDGLNLGANVSDDPARVAENRRILEEYVGAPIVFATQVHGVRVADADRLAQGCTEAGEADAIVTTRRDIGLGVLVADCVPVVIADPVGGVIAVAHAGREGLHSGVVHAVVGAMVDRGAQESRMRAVIGPCVCGSCYEVPEQMRDRISRRRPAAWSSTAWGTPSLDLAAGVLADLAEHGVRAQRVEACTVSDPRFFSHRRDTRAAPTTGRFAGFTRLTTSH